MNESLLEVKSYDGEGYQPLSHTPGWRAALLNDCPEKYRIAGRFVAGNELIYVLKER